MLMMKNENMMMLFIFICNSCSEFFISYVSGYIETIKIVMALSMHILQKLPCLIV